MDLAPATAGPITEEAGSTPEEVELTLDAAHAVKDAWGEASATERAEVLNAFGGYKISGIGRENHLMMLDHHSQTKNLLVSYSTKPLGLF